MQGWGNEAGFIWGSWFNWDEQLRRARLSYSEEMEGKVVQAPLAIRIAKIPKAIDPKRGYEQVEI